MNVSDESRSGASDQRRRTAVITGAAGGIGAAICADLARDTRLVMVDTNQDRLDGLAAELRNGGGEATVHTADVRDYGQMQDVAESAIEDHGSVDIYIANAGIADQSSVADGDPMHWRQVVETNTIGILNGIRTITPHMFQRKAGHIVVLASVSGHTVYEGEPAYIASKHAAVAFAEAVRLEAAQHDVAVTVVMPGLVDTQLLDSNPFAESLRQTVTPLNPTDIARAIRFAVDQSANCVINEMVIRPRRQVT